MTRFGQVGGIVMRNDTTLTVMAMDGQPLNTLIDRGAVVLDGARLALGNTIYSLIQRPLPEPARNNLSTYFSIDLRTPASQTEFVSIKRALKSLATGLNGDITIKTGELPFYGRVEVQNVTEGARRGDAGARLLVNNPRLWPQYRHDKVHHNFTTDLGSGDLLLTRAIKLDSERLRGPLRLAVKTLLHEASHKYAGTVDADNGILPDDHGGAPPLLPREEGTNQR